MAEPSAKLIYDGKEIELPVVRGTEDELGIDIFEAPRRDRAHHASTTAT